MPNVVRRIIDSPFNDVCVCKLQISNIHSVFGHASIDRFVHKQCEWPIFWSTNLINHRIEFPNQFEMNRQWDRVAFWPSHTHTHANWILLIIIIITTLLNYRFDFLEIGQDAQQPHTQRERETQSRQSPECHCCVQYICLRCTVYLLCCQIIVRLRCLQLLNQPFIHSFHPFQPVSTAFRLPRISSLFIIRHFIMRECIGTRLLAGGG